MIMRQGLLRDICIISASVPVILTGALFYCPAAAGQETPAAIIETLDNGLKVIISPQAAKPLATAYLLVKTGSSHEQGYWGSGISHVLEHLMFKGTKNRAASEIEQQIKNAGGYTNGFTSHDATGYIIVLPVENLPLAIEILADQAKNPLFKPEDFEKEKSVVLNELRLNRDSPEKYLSELFWQTAYIRHPYRFPPIGFLPLLERLTLEHVKDYYQKTYIPGNMILAVTCGINKEETLEKIKKEFADMPAANLVQEETYIEPPQTSPRQLVQEHSLTHNQMILGFHSVSIADADMYALDVLAIILGQGESSRLYENLYKRRLAYDISAYSYTPRDAGIFAITAEILPELNDQAINAIWGQIEILKRHRAGIRELNKAKRQVLSSYIRSRESVEAQAADLASNLYLTNDYDFSRQYVEGINKVSADDVQRVAIKYLTRNNSTLVILTPKKEGEKKEIAPQPKPLPARQTIKLPNGITIVLKENNTLPLFSMTLSCRGGVRFENEQNNGISSITATMLVKGTKNYTAEKLSRLSEERGLILAPFSGNNSFGLTLTGLAEDLDLALDIISDIAQNATFPEKELSLARETTLAQIKAADDDIFSYTFKHFKKTLFQSYPYRFTAMGTTSSVSSLKRDDLRRFYNTYFVPENMVLSLSGNFDLAQISAKLNNKFAKLKAPSLPEFVPPNEPRIDKPRYTYNPRPDKQQAVICYGFHTVPIYSRLRYPLEVATAILDSTAGRLYTKIRMEKGWSYTLGGENVFGLDLGYYMLYVATTPENLNNIRSIVESEITRLKTGNISDFEITTAKNMLIGEQQRRLETNAAQSMDTAINELYGLGAGYSDAYPAMIKAVSPQDIKAALDYLDLTRAAITATGPGKNE